MGKHIKKANRIRCFISLTPLVMLMELLPKPVGSKIKKKKRCCRPRKGFISSSSHERCSSNKSLHQQPMFQLALALFFFCGYKQQPLTLVTSQTLLCLLSLYPLRKEEGRTTLGQPTRRRLKTPVKRVFAR